LALPHHQWFEQSVRLARWTGKLEAVLVWRGIAQNKETMSESVNKTEANAVLPPVFTYVALALVSCATLVFEIVLTRIFSVTMWYHYAFLAISLAMFGLTVGALAVWWTPLGNVNQRLAKGALLFSFSILASFLYHTYLPTNPMVVTNPAQKAVYFLLLYLVFSVPFIFSGICICLALTQFPARTGRLYAADLLGASLGCLLVIYILDCTDGPVTVVFSALLAGTAALLFAFVTARPKFILATSACALGLAVFFMICTAGVYAHAPVLKIGWVKGLKETGVLYEKWNSFSRITVSGDRNQAGSPAGWGLSDAYVKRPPIRQLHLQIDSSAGTVLTEYHGDRAVLDHLNFDIINAAHYLRTQANVLVIGVGGGRDVLSALAFDQASVTGVEINQDILGAITDEFGDYTGFSNNIPGVRLVNDEARSFVARSQDKYDIIQASLIDTCAASAAGAFVLAEHALYTTEAWSSFLAHLTPRGIMTFSRWYFLNGKLAPEIFRTVALTRAALLQDGAEDPRRHLIILKPIRKTPNTVATLLISKSPFTADDLEKTARLCKMLQYEVVLGPGLSQDPVWEQLMKGEVPTSPGYSFASFDLSAPTDDKPFFFWIAKPWKLLSLNLFTLEPSPESVLIMALLVVFALSALCFVLPFLWVARRIRGGPVFSLATYFLCIGCGFMFIEIAQMQRLIIFLGHPTYGLSVILFSLLVSSGIGSSLADRFVGRRKPLAFAILLTAVALVGIMSPLVCRHFESQTFLIRLLLAVILMAPAGVAMGFPFPLGMSVAAPQIPAATPWLWGMNGAASVCASIAGVLISLLWGINVTYWMGWLCYLAAFLAWQRSQPVKGAAPAVSLAPTA
jgi:hypothetical protein